MDERAGEGVLRGFVKDQVRRFRVRRFERREFGQRWARQQARDHVRRQEQGIRDAPRGGF